MSPKKATGFNRPGALAPVKCPHCGVKQRHRGVLAIHIKHNHPKLWKGPSQAAIYQKRRYAALIPHLVHVAKYTYRCPVCEFTGTKRLVLRHISSAHSGWKPETLVAATELQQPSPAPEPAFTLNGHYNHPTYATLKTLVAQLRDVFMELDRRGALLDNIGQQALSGVVKPRNGLKRARALAGLPPLQLPQIDTPTPEVQPS